MKNVYVYIALMAFCTFAVRALPLVLIRGEIKNVTIRSFLTYVPYVTLAVMTFPAMVDSSSIPVAGLLALVVGIILALRGASLFMVSLSCCLAVLLVQGGAAFLF